MKVLSPLWYSLQDHSHCKLPLMSVHAKDSFEDYEVWVAWHVCNVNDKRPIRTGNFMGTKESLVKKKKTETD